MPRAQPKAKSKKKSHGGARPAAGRKVGGKNKATIELETNVAQVIDRARREGKDLAVSVLERLMALAEGATGLNRPTSQRELMNGSTANPDGDWDRFGQWFDRTAFCARALAKYQSPQIKAMDAPAPPPDPNSEDKDQPIVFKLRVFEGGKPLAA